MVCLRVDVFCKVIDHLGDIGVCLRLVRSLARDKAWSMRIFCDQHRLASLLTDPQVDQVPWYPWPSEEAQLGSFPTPSSALSVVICPEVSVNNFVIATGTRTFLKPYGFTWTT